MQIIWGSSFVAQIPKRRLFAGPLAYAPLARKMASRHIQLYYRKRRGRRHFHLFRLGIFGRADWKFQKISPLIHHLELLHHHALDWMRNKGVKPEDDDVPMSEKLINQYITFRWNDLNRLQCRRSSTRSNLYLSFVVLPINAWTTLMTFLHVAFTLEDCQNSHIITIRTRSHGILFRNRDLWSYFLLIYLT